jgi:DNA-binding NarL/FixJ family response regulator
MVMTTSVAIVEDNDALRESLADLLAACPDLHCAGTFASAEEFLRVARTLKPHVVLMDIGLPGMSGVEAMQTLRREVPSTDVLMLTVYEDDRRIFEAVCAGATGYLLKRARPEHIIEAIRDIRRGGAPMTPKVARRVLELFRSGLSPATPSAALSEREREVLNALVEGLSYKMIGDRLCISIDTVRSHIKHIYEKLHIHSKAEAIALAMKARR